jgi:hypothetical protein
MDRDRPEPRSDGSHDIWDRIITDFMRMSEAPVRVEVHEQDPSKVEEGLSEAMERLGVEGYTVVNHEGDIWLIEDAGEVVRRRATVELLMDDPGDMPPQDVN